MAAKNKLFSGRKPPRRHKSAPPAGMDQKELQGIRNAITRVNSTVDKIRQIGGSLKADMLGILTINFDGYLTASGRVSMTLAKSGQPRLRERLDAVNDMLKAKIEEWKNIPDDIYDIWKSCIKEYFSFISEVGIDMMQQLAPITTSNIQNVSKGNGSDAGEFLAAVRKWREERRKVLDYLMGLSNATAFTDEDWE